MAGPLLLLLVVVGASWTWLIAVDKVVKFEKARRGGRAAAKHYNKTRSDVDFLINVFLMVFSNFLMVSLPPKNLES